jgi:toxin ParE1/3/4
VTADFRVTSRALKDLRAIGHYTREHWGRPQRDNYLRQLALRFAWLAEHPGFGRRRPELGPGMRSFPQGSHVIFYLVHARGIDIVGLPHRAMDIRFYFDLGAEG